MSVRLIKWCEESRWMMGQPCEWARSYSLLQEIRWTMGQPCEGAGSYSLPREDWAVRESCCGVRSRAGMHGQDIGG